MSIVTRGLGARGGLVSTFGLGRKLFDITLSTFRDTVEYTLNLMSSMQYTLKRVSEAAFTTSLIHEDDNNLER